MPAESELMDPGSATAFDIELLAGENMPSGLNMLQMHSRKSLSTSPWDSTWFQHIVNALQLAHSSGTHIISHDLSTDTDFARHVASTRVGTDAAVHNWQVQHAKGHCFLTKAFVACFFAVVVWFCGYVTYSLFVLRARYRRLKDDRQNGEGFQWTFWSFIDYKLDSRLTREGAENAKIELLFSVFCFFLLFGSIVYWFAVHETNPVTIVYNVFSMLLDPGYGPSEKTDAGKGVGVLVSLAGLFTFALLVALVQNKVNEYLEGLTMGRAAVVEVGHILLIGYTEDTIQLLQELCLAHAVGGGKTIVLLVEDSKTDTERLIRQACIDQHNSEIIVRHGEGHDVNDLKHVSADSCDIIIVNPSRHLSKEMRDAFSLQVLVVLGETGWPCHGRIVAVCSDERNFNIFKTLGGDRIDVLRINRCLGNFMAQASSTAHFCSMVHTLFGFTQCFFSIVEVPPALVGFTFGDASFYYPNAVLVGVRSKRIGQESTADLNQKTITEALCPGRRHLLQKGDEFIVLADARDPNCSTMAGLPGKASATLPFRSKKTIVKTVELDKIIIIGWNPDVVPTVLQELDRQVASGSTVVILSPSSAESREHFLSMEPKCQKLKNLEILPHVVGSLGSRRQLEHPSVSVVDATKIFILSDASFPDNASADACMISSVLQVRFIGDKLGISKKPRVIKEIRTASSERFLVNTNVFSFVNTSKLPARIIATAAKTESVWHALLDLVVDGGSCDLGIKRIGDYLSPDASAPTTLCFWDVMELVTTAGDVLIGWSAPEEIRRQRSSAEVLDRVVSTDFKARIEPYFDDHYLAWEMNPLDKASVRAWDAESDILLVIEPCSKMPRRLNST